MHLSFSGEAVSLPVSCARLKAASYLVFMLAQESTINCAAISRDAKVMGCGCRFKSAQQRDGK
jgi:hypothetical protein